MTNERKTNKVNIATLDASWIKYCLVSATILFGLFYVWQVNISATHGYAMRDLENEITDIEHQNERLQYEVSRLRSIDSVTNRVQMLGLTKIDNVNYLTTGGDSAVAVLR